MENLAILLWAFIGLTVLAGIYKRRENLGHNLRHLVIAVAVGAFAWVVAQQVEAIQNAAPILAGMAMLLAYATRPRRSRHIRASVKRRTIAEWESRTGKKFNSRTHELDHIVPFSKGGSSTADNLEVVKKKRNRSKGARSEWWDLLGRR